MLPRRCPSSTHSRNPSSDLFHVGRADAPKKMKICGVTERLPRIARLPHLKTQTPRTPRAPRVKSSTTTAKNKRVGRRWSPPGGLQLNFLLANNNSKKLLSKNKFSLASNFCWLADKKILANVKNLLANLNIFAGQPKHFCWPTKHFVVGQHKDSFVGQPRKFFVAKQNIFLLASSKIFGWPTKNSVGQHQNFLLTYKRIDYFQRQLVVRALVAGWN